MKEEAKKQEGIELEYYKAPLAKRFVAFLIDMTLTGVLTLGIFCLLRLAVENSAPYESAFSTYVSISKDSRLYTYEETEDNLVQIVTYAKGTYEDDYAKQVDFCETRISYFYSEDPIDIFDGDEGIKLYANEKAGDSAFKQNDGSAYFAYDSNGVPQAIVNDEALIGFYEEAILSAIQYLSRSEAYVNASKTLSKTINLLLIPSSIVIGALVFEFLIPLIFFRRGWQTLGMRIFHLSLITSKAISPRFRTFLFRFLWLLLAETLLSMMTFAVPLFITFGMAIIRKDGQAFHDYMAGVYMVDSSDQTVYLSKEEYMKLREQAELTESRPYLSTWHGDHLDEPKKEEPKEKRGS